MIKFQVRVIDPVGLHARPATVAVNVASKCKGDVKVSYNNRSVNMKSIMGVMSLGVPTQSDVIISCEGEDEENSIKTIIDTLKEQKVIDLNAITEVKES